MVGFVQEPPKETLPIVPCDFRHAMGIGETGCGKTSSFILPNIKDRLSRGHGLFVLDYKGSLHAQVKALALEEKRLEDVLEIGVPWGGEIGLLKGVSKSLLLESLEHLLGDETDKFWSTSSLSTIGAVYEGMTLMEQLKEIARELDVSTIDPKPFTLDNFVKTIQNLDKLKELCTQMGTISTNFSESAIKQYYSKNKHREFALAFQYATSLNKIFDRLSNFVSTIDEDKPAAGSGGIHFQMYNLMVALEAPGLSGDDDLLDLLDSGKIVLLRCDSFPPRLATVLMHILYTRLAKRITCKRPVSLFVDEFQRSVSKDALPFVDVFREKKVELIGAMQNLEQLEIQTGEKEAYAFLGNVVHQYNYKEDEPFCYETKGATKRAAPIFLDGITIDKAQLAWQENLERSYQLPKGWIYTGTNDTYTSQIRHIKTGEVKTYYLLKRSREFEKIVYKMAVEDAAPKSPLHTGRHLMIN